jgi:hypothetical protein
MMRNRWTPSIVPDAGDQNVYLVLDRFERNGCAWREADAGDTDLETVIRDLMSGQYNDPQRVVAFNPVSTGPMTFPKTSRAKSGAGPTVSMKTFPRALKTSSSATLAGSGNLI